MASIHTSTELWEEFSILGDQGWRSSLLIVWNLTNRKKITYVPKTLCSYRLSLKSVCVGGRNRTSVWVHKAAKSSVFCSNKRLPLFQTHAHTIWTTEWQALVPSIKKGCAQEQPIAFQWRWSPGSAGAAVQKRVQRRGASAASRPRERFWSPGLCPSHHLRSSPN